MKDYCWGKIVADFDIYHFSATKQDPLGPSLQSRHTLFKYECCCTHFTVEHRTVADWSWAQYGPILIPTKCKLFSFNNVSNGQLDAFSDKLNTFNEFRDIYSSYPP